MRKALCLFALTVTAGASAQELTVISPTDQYWEPGGFESQEQTERSVICRLSDLSLTQLDPSNVISFCGGAAGDLLYRDLGNGYYLYAPSSALRDEDINHFLYETQCEDECDGPSAECDQLVYSSSDDEDDCDDCTGPSAECTQHLLQSIR